MEDPSLLTADFCCGQPAVRGWELNEWLKMFTEKDVRVTVSLDSCYLGGGRRKDGEQFWTPNDWLQSIPNLPLDQHFLGQTLHDQPISSKFVLHQYIRGLHDDPYPAKLETPWSLDPRAFTLMTACQSHEQAREKSIDGLVFGAFTYELMRYLDQDDLFIANERIRDQPWSRLEGL